MEVKLLPKDVVERAQLDARAARYVLDSLGPATRRGRLAIPAASQGQHRVLNLDEASRLALCTRLNMLGLPFAVAELTTIRCEAYWRAITKGEPVTHLFDGSLGNPWRIELVNNCKFVWIGRDRPARKNNEEVIQASDYYRVEDWKRFTQLDVPPGLPKITWSLTHAAADLAEKPKAR